MDGTRGRTTRRVCTAAVASVLGLALAGCADDGSDGDDTSPPTATEGAPTEAAPTEGTATEPGDADATITIRDFAFGAPVTVPVGATIEVVNADGTAHTWTADDGSFDSGTLSPEGTFAYVAETAGTFDFSCSIHPSMTGTLTVGDG